MCNRPDYFYIVSEWLTPTLRFSRDCCTPRRWSFQLGATVTLQQIKSKSTEDLITGCWNWNGHLVKGYGKIRINYRRYPVHRVAYEIVNGKTPDGLLVLHRCDNPACVNPSHLFLGTYLDNSLDCLSKGRRNTCEKERHWNCRLTEKQVSEIRQSNQAIRIIASQFGISTSHVRSIKSGFRWKSPQKQFNAANRI